MALFGSKEKKTTTAKKIRPTVLRVQNVAKELLALAKSYEVKVDSIDFNILEVQTYTRVNEEKKEAEWEEIAPDEVYELDDATALLNHEFEIKQMYEVEFFTKKIDNNPFHNFNVAVGANATKCKVYLSIKEGTSVSYSSYVEEKLKTHINKAKLRAGILINIFDEMLDDVVSKLIAQIRVEENTVYQKNETILIAQSHEPTLTINDELILHYDDSEDDIDENKKIDYASRGFIKAVQKDEALIEYIKAQLGKPGRNCRGEYMAPKETEVTCTPTFTVDETIREVDSPNNIEYIANENGYVTFEGNVYGIKTDVDIGEISFKTTGNITSGVNSNVSINVSEKDIEKDAIGMGMEVEVTEIDIEGNVGSNAKLTAVRAKISGQIHKSAEVRADKLELNVHKGKAYGKHINIERLEHGIVDGDKVEIVQALGGNIRAHEITLEICASHVKATASKFIEIKKMQGSENTFIIDPLVKKSTMNESNDNSKVIQLLERELRDIKNEIEICDKKIKDGTAAFNDIKKRLIHYKKNGIKMPSSFVTKYKQFQQLQVQLEGRREAHSLKKSDLEIAMSQKSVFQSDITDARIINRGGWKGFNEIIFKLVDPPIDISYKPVEGSSGKVFGLVQIGEGEYDIQVIDE